MRASTNDISINLRCLAALNERIDGWFEAANDLFKFSEVNQARLGIFVLDI